MSYRELQKYCVDNRAEIEILQGYRIRCQDKLIVFKKYVDSHKYSKIVSKYTFGDMIGQGGFSKVYLAQENDGKKSVAIKLNKKKKGTNSSFREIEILKHLKGIAGIPTIFCHYTDETHSLIAMELLGPCLFDVDVQNINLGSIARQILTTLQRIHEEGILHLDIKPGNIVYGGTKENGGSVYIIDFGVAVHYRDENGNHNQYTTDSHFRGTYEYASSNIIAGIEPSRRDDLISLGYTLAALYINLPWKDESKKIRLAQGEVKDDLKEDLATKKKLMGDLRGVKELPEAISKYLRAVLKLGYDETPDYKNYRKMFKAEEE